MRIRTLASLLAVFICGEAAAAMYKWVDEDGNIHYTQSMPPQGAKLLQKSQMPRSRPPAAVSQDNAERAPARQAQPATDESRTTAVPAELTPEQKEQYRKTCERLKKNLDLLMEPKRVFVTTKEGNRHYLSDQERDERIRRINSQLPRYCQKQ